MHTKRESKPIQVRDITWPISTVGDAASGKIQVEKALMVYVIQKGVIVLAARVCRDPMRSHGEIHKGGKFIRNYQI